MARKGKAKAGKGKAKAVVSATSMIYAASEGDNVPKRHGLKVCLNLPGNQVIQQWLQKGAQPPPLPFHVGDIPIHFPYKPPTINVIQVGEIEVPTPVRCTIGTAAGDIRAVLLDRKYTHHGPPPGLVRGKLRTATIEEIGRFWRGRQATVFGVEGFFGGHQVSGPACGCPGLVYPYFSDAGCIPADRSNISRFGQRYPVITISGYSDQLNHCMTEFVEDIEDWWGSSQGESLACKMAIMNGYYCLSAIPGNKLPDGQLINYRILNQHTDSWSAIIFLVKDRREDNMTAWCSERNMLCVLHKIFNDWEGNRVPDRMCTGSIYSSYGVPDKNKNDAKNIVMSACFNKSRNRVYSENQCVVQLEALNAEFRIQNPCYEYTHYVNLEKVWRQLGDPESLDTY